MDSQRQRFVWLDYSQLLTLTVLQQLKQRVRDVIDPGRDLGHVDGKKAIKASLEILASGSGASENTTNDAPSCIPKSNPQGEICKDC